MPLPLHSTARETVDAYSDKWRSDRILMALFGPDALSVRNAEERAGEQEVARMNRQGAALTAMMNKEKGHG